MNETVVNFVFRFGLHLQDIPLHTYKHPEIQIKPEIQTLLVLDKGCSDCVQKTYQGVQHSLACSKEPLWLMGNLDPVSLHDEFYLAWAAAQVMDHWGLS